MPVIPKNGGPWSLFCTDCGTWTPNTANYEMKKEGVYAHSHRCDRMTKDDISDKDWSVMKHAAEVAPEGINKAEYLIGQKYTFLQRRYDFLKKERTNKEKDDREGKK